MSQPREPGFRFTPIPHYSTTTRRGTHVSCGGCCLPLPVGCLASVIAMAVPAVMALARRRALRQL